MRRGTTPMIALFTVRTDILMNSWICTPKYIHFSSNGFCRLIVMPVMSVKLPSPHASGITSFHTISMLSCAASSCYQYVPMLLFCDAIRLVRRVVLSNHLSSTGASVSCLMALVILPLCTIALINSTVISTPVLTE
jgi:hypothetical protein